MVTTALLGVLCRRGDWRNSKFAMSARGHSRPGRGSSKSGHVRYAPKAEGTSEHLRLRDRPLRLMVRP